MNELELIVYNAVKRNLLLKRIIRDVYQRIFVLSTFSWLKKAESEYVIEQKPQCFFGYYDKSPWSTDNHYLLAHHFDIPLRIPRKDDRVEIRYYDGDSYQKLATTRAWNWQQGAMTQWLGGSLQVIFNDFCDDRHIARIVDLSGREIAMLPMPISALSPTGDYAVSYSFERLRRCAPGYGYANGKSPNEKIVAPSNDGLFMIALSDYTSQLLFSLRELATLDPEPSMEGAYHYVNHAMFSPSGAKVVFFHRWQKSNREWTRMFTYNALSGRLHLFDTGGMVSHFTWQDEDHILAWARLPNRRNDACALFTDGSQERRIIAESLLISDGHPSFSPNGKWILTDTYPDRSRMSHLVLYDMKTHQRSDIAKLYNPFCYTNDMRCDLHPRWNRDGSAVSFDAIYNGARSLCTLRLGEDIGV